MVKCKPERNPRQAVVIILVFAVLALSCAFLINISGEYKIFAQILFALLLAVCLQFVYRYTMCEMVYAVGEGIFSVTRIVGKKQTVLCSLNLSETVALLPKSEFKKSKNKYRANIRKYNHNQNIRCNGSYVYVTEFNKIPLVIEFEPNEIFVGIMTDEIQKSKNSD